MTNIHTKPTFYPRDTNFAIKIVWQGSYYCQENYVLRQNLLLYDTILYFYLMHEEPYFFSVQFPLDINKEKA
jgi:hypothetical protein